MSEQIAILIERKGKKHFTRFIELFINRAEVSVKEIKSKIPRSTFYKLVLSRIYIINQSIKNLDPSLEPFIIPAFYNDNGKIVYTFKRNCDIKIVDEDPNFFYLRLRVRGSKNA